MASSPTQRADVVVLGAGLQGSCVALALATQGHRVTVLEQADQPMTATSRNTEAKIHLGYVYAADRAGITQRRMLEGALAFSPLLDRWLGAQPWASFVSPPFRYLTMVDSLLSPDELEDDYARTDAAVDDVRTLVAESIRGTPNYLGGSLDARARRDPPGTTAAITRAPMLASFSTPERGVDPERLADAVSHALLHHPGITVVLGTEVRGATRDRDGFALDTVTDGEPVTRRARIVVNCLWADRLRVDATVGVDAPVRDWVYRVKHLVIVRPRDTMPVPTVTMVQGPFGDVIEWAKGRVCLSWYPIARTELRAVTSVNPDSTGLLASTGSGVIGEKTVEVMAGLFPSLAGATVVDTRAGVIVAPGASDIDDPRSRLHRRANPAVHAHDGWWTIDTGKLTLAPLLAHDASTQIDGALRGA